MMNSNLSKMKKSFSLLLLLSGLKCYSLAGYKDCGKDPEPRQEFSLVAGIKASVLQHPWAMLITKYGNSLVHCSGSLVTPKFGLSAGHCFTGNSPDYLPTDEMSLFFGVGDIKQLTGKIPFRAFKIQKRAIKKILTHPGYQYPRAYKDVSIIEFDMPVELTSTIYPVCLPEISLDPEHLAGEPAIVIGYGPHNDGTSLNKANQRVYQEEYCSDKYSLEDASTDNAKLIKAELPDGFDGTIICSGNRRASEGTCRGDSGGPLLIDEYMDGEFITIQNGVLHGSLQSCSNQKYPAIFSRLSNPDIHNWLFSKLFDIEVSCGQHKAGSCAGCPQGNGASWCNGDCQWIDDQCVKENSGDPVSACEHRCSRDPKSCPITDKPSVDLTVDNPTKADDMKKAIQNDDLRGLNRLLKELNLKNPIIQSFYGSVLHYSAFEGKFEIFKNISATVADMQPKSLSGKNKGGTPLHYAASEGRMNILQYIANCVSNINPPADNGLTPMHWAAQNGHLDVINFYIDRLDNKNPPLNSNDEYKGETPLHWAANWGQLELVKAITAVVSDKNPKDSHGYTPLHAAASDGHLQVVKYLCENFVNDVNIQMDSFWNRRTPLHKAAENGHLEVVKYLINKGADPKIKSSKNKTAYDLAIDGNHSDVSNYLQQFN